MTFCISKLITSVTTVPFSCAISIRHLLRQPFLKQLYTTLKQITGNIKGNIMYGVQLTSIEGQNTFAQRLCFA